MLAIGDLLLVLAAALLLLVPGGALLAVTGWTSRHRWPVLLGAAPLVTTGLAYLATLITQALNLAYGVLSFLLVALAGLIAAVAIRLLLRRRGSTGAVPDRGAVTEPEAAAATAPREPWWQRHISTVMGLLATALAAGISLASWGQGLRSLSAVPQEHDTITHTLVTAYITYSGNAAPGDSYPVDLLTGSPDAFYPQGFHIVAALVADAGTDPVRAMNAMMLAVFAIVVPLGMFALGSLLRPTGLGRLAGGAAAVIAVLAYRPAFALMHDGGVVSNAVAFAVAPGAVAAILALMPRVPHGRADRAVDAPGAADADGRVGTDRRTGRRHRNYLADIVLTALVMIGAFAIHPTSAVLVGVGVVAWRAGELATDWPGWPALRSWLLTVSAAAVLTVLAALPILGQVLGAATTVQTWPRDFPVVPLYQGLGLSVGMPYGGFLDPAITLSQPLLAGLSLLGIVAALLTRRHGGLVLAWLAWLILLLNYLANLSLPILTTFANTFYNSYPRISGGFAPYQWLLAGLALAAVGRWIAAGVHQLFRRGSSSARGLRTAVTAAVTFALVLIVAALSADSIRTNIFSVEKRYAEPDFFRVDEDDIAAIDFLAGQVQPGERVMNNANDGSTYLYVYEQIPIVETAPLGIDSVDYTQDLLADFNLLDDNARIQDLVRSLNIRWVYVDSEAPFIGSPPEIYPWWGEPSYSTPPGFHDLDEVAALSEVFTAGSVSVYQVSDDVFT